MAEKYIEQALYDLLTTDTDIINTNISIRSYWEEAPAPEQVTIPYCTFSTASDTMQEWALQKGNTGTPRISINVYSNNKADISIARVILNKLRGFIGTLEGVVIENSDVTAWRSFKDDTGKIWVFGFDWIPVYELNQ